MLINFAPSVNKSSSLGQPEFERTLSGMATRTRLRVAVRRDQSPDEHAAIGPGFDLAGLLGGEKLAMGDPDHVPAGQYAMRSLTAAGYWDNLPGRLVPSANVRDALRFAETGQTPYAIVYESDAAAGAVTVVARLPDPVPPIGYVALPVRNAPNVDDFMGFLVSAKAEEYLCEHGFRLTEGRAC